MNDNHTLARLCKLAGVSPRWTDVWGQTRDVAPPVLRAVLAALDLPAATPAQAADTLARWRERPPAMLTARAGGALRVPGDTATRYAIELDNGQVVRGLAEPDAAGGLALRAPRQPGYHSLRVGNASIALAVAPPRAPTLARLLASPRPRRWGVAAQIYSLRGTADPDDGHGDFGAVAELAVAAASHGADALALSPAHALFAAAPRRCSPYSPSTRLFLNILYADPLDTFSAAECAAARRPSPCADGPLIDWPQSAGARLAMLRRLHRGLASDDPRAAELARFRAEGGPALRDHALFEALHAANGATDWRGWPAAWRNPAAALAAGCARDHVREVDFHIFAQWLARRSLAHAQAAACEAGMGVGLIADLAVGVDPAGSQTWAQPDAMLGGLNVGAAPDLHHPGGQDWRLTACSPATLATQGYAAYIDMLRRALASTGGVRIDHVLGLARLWVIPEGAPPDQGAYLAFPVDDLLRLAALEAWRHRAVLIGENLGTVPPDFNARLRAHGVLGMNVLWLQRETGPGGAGRFRPPRRWPASAVAMTSTHDLPTLRGWWQERDIDWCASAHEAGAQRRQRDQDRRALWRQAAPPGLAATAPPAEPPRAALLSHVARCRAPLMLVPLEDLAGLAEQPNVPGCPSHPNWRRRMPATAAAMLAQPAARQALAAIAAYRGRP